RRHLEFRALGRELEARRSGCEGRRAVRREERERSAIAPRGKHDGAFIDLLRSITGFHLHERSVFEVGGDLLARLVRDETGELGRRAGRLFARHGELQREERVAGDAPERTPPEPRRVPLLLRQGIEQGARRGGRRGGCGGGGGGGGRRGRARRRGGSGRRGRHRGAD